MSLAEGFRPCPGARLLHIARQEDMKNVVSQEGHEQKTIRNSAWIMLEDLIGSAISLASSLKPLILDIPSLVVLMDDAIDGKLGKR